MADKYLVDLAEEEQGYLLDVDPQRQNGSAPGGTCPRLAACSGGDHR